MRGNVWLSTQDYKSQRVAVVSCATLVNTQTHIQAAFDQLYSVSQANADGRRSKILVQETCTRILVQEVCPCVISFRMSFFSYEKLG